MFAKRVRRGLAAALLAMLPLAPTVAVAAEDDTFSYEEVMDKARGFFGATTEGLAKAVEKVFEDLGRPNAIIEGEEVAGAIFVGLRYGRGTITKKGSAAMPVYWQGPSVGFDFGGNASKSFTLVYALPTVDDIYRRFPGVDGSFYFVGGLGVNYQRIDGITLAPMRTGMGLRAGANIGYLHYGREHSWLPF